MVPEGQSLTQPVLIPRGQSCFAPHSGPGGEFRASLVISGQGILAAFTEGHSTVGEPLQMVKGCKSPNRSFTASC